MNKKAEIIEFLEYLFPNPKASLNYKKDYEFLIAVMLSAQTTDLRVNEVTKELFKYSLEDINNLSISSLEELIKPLGTYKKKAVFVKEIANRLLKEENYHESLKSRDFLESLPGVGRKTANVFLSEIYNEAHIAVDTHVSRVSKRLNISKESADVLEIEKDLMKFFDKKNWGRRHKQLVLFGRHLCKARSPECYRCRLQNYCKYYKKKQF